jgi:hypothetical protein
MRKQAISLKRSLEAFILGFTIRSEKDGERDADIFQIKQEGELNIKYYQSHNVPDQDAGSVIYLPHGSGSGKSE